MREGLQRAEVDSPQAEGVKEKVRAVVEELTGMEADTDTTKNDKVTALNTAARDLRKFIYTTQAEIGGASIEQLQEIKNKVDALVEESYRVREAEEECPTCVVSPEMKEVAEKVNLEQYGGGVSEKRKKLLEELQQDNVQDEFF